LLNLTHYDSAAVPAPAEPTTYSVHVQLNHVAHALREGHRVRLAISTSYWRERAAA
jgi:predicted acyl esterase